jgi:hypothetical protein
MSLLVCGGVLLLPDAFWLLQSREEREKLIKMKLLEINFAVFLETIFCASRENHCT